MKTLTAFAFSTMLTVALLFFGWRISLGYYAPDTNNWLVDVFTLKDRAARSISGPKVVVVSGSNALFGLDTENLSKLMGRPVLNLATHGGLPFDFLAESALNYTVPGDLVVMPLEYAFYGRDPRPSEFEIASMESWGAAFTLSRLDRSILYFRSTSLLRMVRIFFIGSLPPEAPADLFAVANRNTARGLIEWTGYSYRSVNSFGDALVDGQNVYKDDKNYIVKPPRFEVAQEIGRFQDRLEEKGARLWLTWPVSIRNPDFDLAKPRARASVDEIRRELAKAGVEIHCEASDFQFDRTLFLDTNYHLNALGAEFRTAALASCLNGVAVDPQLGPRLFAARKKQADAFDRLSAVTP